MEDTGNVLCEEPTVDTMDLSPPRMVMCHVCNDRTLMSTNCYSHERRVVHYSGGPVPCDPCWTKAYGSPYREAILTRTTEMDTEPILIKFCFHIYHLLSIFMQPALFASRTSGKLQLLPAHPQKRLLHHPIASCFQAILPLDSVSIKDPPEA